MKKILLFTLFLSFSIAANAQLLLGGQFSIHASSDESHNANTTLETSKYAEIIVLPRLGYIFGDFMAGVDAGFRTTALKTPDFPNGTNETTTAAFQIGPFMRYTKKPVPNFGIWAEAQVNAAFGQREFNKRKTDETFGLDAGIRPGVIFYVGKHLSFEASFGQFGFTSTRFTDPDNSDNFQTENDFGLDLGGTFDFGVNWTF